MLILKKIVVTGGLGSGKSVVCGILKTCGAYVVSADEIVHGLLSPKTAIGKQVIALLGPEILVNQEIDRAKIAEKVFSQPELLQRLEKILHPAVLDEIKRAYQTCSKQKQHSFFVAEIPLLYESESHPFFDCVIAVIADDALAKKRFVETTSHPPSAYDLRMKRQMKPQEKAAKADYVIENNGTLDELRIKVIQLSNELLK